MAKNDNLQDFLTDVADAIREKKGTTALINPQDFAAEIASIEGGGGVINNQDKYVAVTKNGTTEVTADAGFTGLGKVIINTNVASSGGGAVRADAVNFRDYDGTVLYSYTATEFANLTEMPSLPTRQGLICQGWNWLLADAQSYVATYGMLEIGATYITDDSKTRLHIKIAAEGRMDVPLYIQQTVSNGVTIDWGDGSATETISGTGKVNAYHTYAEIGEYTISLNPLSGCWLRLGHNYENTYSVFGNLEVYSNMLQVVEIGGNVASIERSTFYNCHSLANVAIPQGWTSIGSHAFYGCHSLASVAIPQGVTGIEMNTFRGCSSLVNVAIPQGVTGIGTYAFQGCSSLVNVVIPQGVTSIVSYAFQSCYSLASVVIPQSVTSIGSYAFQSCYSLASVVISQGVTSIGEDTFDNCSSLTSVVIPQSVTSIGEVAFYRCYSLVSVVISQGVTSIGGSMFGGCEGVAYYDFSSHTIVPLLTATNAFSSIPADCKIVVPVGLLEVWKNAPNWNTYVNNIIADYTPSECLSLQIEADDVVGNNTTTAVRFTAVINGTSWRGEYVEGITINGLATSEAFPKNESTTDSVTREVSFTYFGVTATTTITQGPYVDYEISCKYNVTSTSSATQLLYSSFSKYSTYFSKMLIDGEEVPVAQKYTFATTGEHEVVFKVSDDNTQIETPYRMFYNITALTEVDCSMLDLSKATSVLTNEGTAYMFYGCTGLKKIVLPESIAYMGYYMFYNCKAVTELTILNPVAPTLYGNATFGNTNYYIGYTNRSAGTNKFYVPAGATGYDESYWTSRLQNKSYCGFTKEEIAE